MKKVLRSYGRAFFMQFNIRMILLSMLPSLVSLLLWATLLYFSLQPLMDFLQDHLVSTPEFQQVGNLLGFLGLVALKAFIVPLFAMWLLLPIMLITALIFVSLIAMPFINRSISARYFPGLKKKHGASWWRSAGFALVNLLVFLLLWAATLPLCLVLNIGFALQPVLVGWFTYRVMAFDSLAAHASPEERRQVMAAHRGQLWLVGIVSGLMSALPGMVWLGGVQWIVLLPFCAAIAIWMYVLIFMFSGLWFQLFCLDALQHLRSGDPQGGSMALALATMVSEE